MNLQEIEQRVSAVDVGQGFDFINDLLRAYGHPKATIDRLRNGSYNKSDRDDDVLKKDRVYYRLVEAEDNDLRLAIDDAMNDERIVNERPRFLIVRDSKQLLALDMHTNSTLDIRLGELGDHAAFFMPWAGIEKTQLNSLNYAYIMASKKI